MRSTHLSWAILFSLLCLPPATLPAQSTSSRSTTAAEMAARIDVLLEERWDSAGISPAAPASDAEFLRRAYLDLTGVIPPVSVVRRYLADPAPAKSAALIDQLLDSPRHATHLANTWRNIILPDGFSAEMGGGASGMQQWLRGRFAQNLRYDRLVGDFLTATGGSESGPALYYQALDAQPEKLAASTARIFLGMQLECAQCHDHPFDDWSQYDFWGYAAFFAQVRGDTQGGTFSINDVTSGEVEIPEENEVVPPKFPGGVQPSGDHQGARRLQLSIWMSSPNNPFLARATVNRVWSLLFGRGLVNPVDDLRPENQPIHPAVLDELSQFFVAANYDLRELFRTLAYTKAYQLTSRSESAELGEARSAVFAQMSTKALTAEQLFDSLQQGLHLTTNGENLPSSQVVGNPQRQTFVTQIKTKTRDATEYGAGIQQTLHLMNGNDLAAGTNNLERGLLAALEAPFFDDETRLDTLFLATLSRYPSQCRTRPAAGLDVG